MIVYRIAQTKYAQDITGSGAKKYGGRWNRPGVAALYTSQQRSLCMLELLVHFNAQAAFKQDYSFMTIDIGESDMVDLSHMQYTASDLFLNNESLWRITDKHFAIDKKSAIKVPSVIIPQEFNIIINPEHSSFGANNLKQIEKAVVDHRLAL